MKNIHQLMLKANPIPSFNFFDNKQLIYKDIFMLYKSDNRYYIVYEIPHHAIDIRFVEITETEAFAVQKSHDDAYRILSRYL